MRIKKNDNVIVLSGKDKGKTGKVLQVLPAGERAVVQAVNIRTLHAKPKKQGEKGQMIKSEAPVHISNIMMICPKCAKPARLGARMDEKNKVRVCKRCDAVV
ncbi:50S ribosomal protein L24 [Candidatus Azambacteria bacterium RIFCSPHIGHO2_02_FULL_52_12]|uniref:Large ribosomal subunit protein uL24 n=1 Tax=Candidatus Azambacteria bacterium RIFCSPLOWO2_01_FULL_46_25 TaxID=1797298 RepID=A0A1F5BU63_9BACT|nr:MAG: 50S ribosomal protein L24 [Candidatus Azambacteria bacterium RIFCSPHIGHO2_02_FULL_52_12]OGD34132.1 MAG: 50S ribosomal protein L24 [Candidatus Azambacteria bacterium RIFCSPLOWO2_01_FULL_46_25]OGD36731.1 MAG: 50S ribosomal protein L24 [Candidatus Azambacteria bacterium RIFCSPHIGHO2_01_FULL_51_74]